jgi:hypothetical protein
MCVAPNAFLLQVRILFLLGYLPISRQSPGALAGYDRPATCFLVSWLLHIAKKLRHAKVTILSRFAHLIQLCPPGSANLYNLPRQPIVAA